MRSLSLLQMHQEYIYRWNNSHRTPAEHQQKTLDARKDRKCPHITGQDKRKKKGKRRGEEVGWNLHPWRGGEEEETLLHPGKPPHQWGNQLGQKGNIRGCWRWEKRLLWQTGQSETYTDGRCHSPACTDWDMCPSVHMRAGSWNMGIGEQIHGDDCYWL